MPAPSCSPYRKALFRCFGRNRRCRYDESGFTGPAFREPKNAILLSSFGRRITKAFNRVLSRSRTKFSLSDGTNVYKLSELYFDNDTVHLSKALLGAYIIRNYNGERLTVRIVETEAYCGIEDKGSHTYNDTRTPRTEVMYGPPGRAYIYLIYGMYYCLNIVTRPEGIPSAVLIRAVEPVEGLNTMSLLRYGEPYEKLDKKKRIGLTNGPGKLCMAWGLRRNTTGRILRKTIYVLVPISSPDIVTTKRINIDYAEEAADYPWRFIFEGMNMYRKVTTGITSEEGGLTNDKRKIHEVLDLFFVFRFTSRFLF